MHLTGAPCSAAEPDCAACHGALSTGTSVHAAVSMGCASCHSAVDASVVPHKITNRNPKGLGSKMRDLCYSCHDKKPFMKSTVHGALMLGCTACHNPHASEHAHLLKADVPRLCLNCHEERIVALKDKGHAKEDVCSNCHNPHATDSPKLVLTKPQSTSSNQTALVTKPQGVKQ